MGFLSSLTKVFKRQASESAQHDRVSVTAQFNHKLGPLQRGDVYEDPLIVELDRHGIGEVDGGGTMQNKDGEIDFCDVHMFLSSPEQNIPRVIAFLEALGAPKGSKFLFYTGDNIKQEIPFGTREGFGVYLDGVNLPDEVYRDCDSNLVLSELNSLVSGHGEVESHWQGPTETALYIYGDSNAIMKPLIASFIDSYPLCKGARVVDLTPP